MNIQLAGQLVHRLVFGEKITGAEKKALEYRFAKQATRKIIKPTMKTGRKRNPSMPLTGKALAATLNTGGGFVKTAKRLKISRVTLSAWMKALGVKHKDVWYSMLLICLMSCSTPDPQPTLGMGVVVSIEEGKNGDQCGYQLDYVSPYRPPSVYYFKDRCGRYSVGDRIRI